MASYISPSVHPTSMAAPRENKLRAFFRARSRSRPSDPMPDPRQLTPRDQPESPPSSYLKSSLRSQNRPISSTTTATHSTITPLPSDALRNRASPGRHAYPFQPHAHTPPQDHDPCNDDDPPRAETPSSTRRKLVWQSFFGLSLSRRSSPSTARSAERKGSASTFASEPRSNSSRKRSFRLTPRPTTPRSVDSSSSKSPYAIPVPSSPLPLTASPRRRSFGLGSSQRTTPRSSAGHLPLPLPLLHSPQSGRPHGRRHSVGSERPPHDSAVALPEEPSHRSALKPVPNGGGRNKGKERENSLADSERPLHDIRPPFDFPSQSLPVDPSPISRNYASRHPISHLPTVDSVSSGENQLSPHRLHVIPQIIHTPPTPQRPGEGVDTSSRPSTTLPRIDSGKIEIAKGKTVAVAHREQVLVSSSHSYPDAQHTASSKGRFTPRFLAGKDLPKTKDTSGQKSNRRPAADGPTYKSPGSNIGPARNMYSHRGKLGSFDFERPVSPLNRSSSTVDRQNSHVPTISEDSVQGAKSHLIVHHPAQAESPMLSQITPDHTGGTSVFSFSSVSLQTRSTGKDVGGNAPAGQSSSWGRASGRRVLRTSHGTFAFEQPSSVPSSPNPHTFNLPSGPHQNDSLEHTPGVAQSQPATPLHAVFDARVKHSRGQSCNTSDYANPGERKSKGKGRSLDLGLGLSWAPSRLREEVLMPGLILAREKAKLEKNKANGSDVTKLFESLLPESQFRTFKKHVRRFDAHLIPLRGPSGLLALVERLLAESGLDEREKDELMSEFTVFVENHGG